MSVAHTSQAAYEDHVSSGGAAKQARRVYIVIRYGAYYPTNKEIARALNMDPGTVSARRRDLIRENLIIEAPQRKCTITGRFVKTWRPTR